ncbi:MAG: 4-hydroxybenzoate octaprenyltransferase [Acetobacteraceae bacterium]|nr:4-hydroxybenzoate octaprenyltransferase [Acetobacteraceae bacterium]MDW8398267.1 4-hydroxybenzoate octaprenyltransferase [Acetobacteraceae bacterium]
MSGHTDIRPGGLIARLPAAWRPYALLMRLDRPIGSWLLFLPGPWAFALAAPDWATGLRLALLFGVGAVVMRGAGCVVNDLWDRDLDAKVTRTAGRPIASGAIGPKQALLFLLALLLIGLVILLQLPPLAVWLGVASLLPVALYPLAKRVTDWPQAVLGVVFSYAAPMGWAAATGTLAPAAFALWAAGFFWIMGYDTIYAHQDREDDALVGVRSSARALSGRTRPFLAAMYGLMLLCLLAAVALSGAHWLAAAGLALPAVLLARQVAAFDMHDPARCLALFRANRDVGILVALALLLGRL